jgi:hypothetical protein
MDAGATRSIGDASWPENLDGRLTGAELLPTLAER